ncbi:hypothetical protein QAD02_010282 [Eretmocerus hayati]|uniref:Uncharacterized protein n=1 Tax=Eretmocerus hayati TaxID=131215 RepID=A0ACC2NBM5_9HYME|nr:hypothetical protein QAD02_010282 [Eretmocerus hayati]
MSAFQVVASVLLLTLAVLGAPPQDVQKKENADIGLPISATQAQNSSANHLNENPLPAQQQLNVTSPINIQGLLRNLSNNNLDSPSDTNRFFISSNLFNPGNPLMQRILGFFGLA